MTKGGSAGQGPNVTALGCIITVARSRTQTPAPGTQRAPREHLPNEPVEGARLSHAGSAASPLTMLEKVAECRDTNTLSCSSRLQMPGSMSQDRMPVGGQGGGTAGDVRWEVTRAPQFLEYFND